MQNEFKFRGEERNRLKYKWREEKRAGKQFGLGWTELKWMRENVRRKMKRSSLFSGFSD